MHREKISPSAASLCAILSSTDLIVLVMLCRARSEADAARRLRPPSPTARESSLVSASISCSACSARSTFPSFLGFFQFFAQLGKPAPVSGLGLLVEHLARVTQTADMDARLFEILIPPRQAACGLTGFVILALACDSTRQIEHMEFDRRDDAADGRGTRVPWCPLDERLSRRSLRSSTRPLCGRSLFAQNGRWPPDRRFEPSQVARSASQVPSEFSRPFVPNFCRTAISQIAPAPTRAPTSVVRPFFTPRQLKQSRKVRRKLAIGQTARST